MFEFAIYCLCAIVAALALHATMHRLGWDTEGTNNA